MISHVPARLVAFTMLAVLTAAIPATVVMSSPRARAAAAPTAPLPGPAGVASAVASPIPGPAAAEPAADVAPTTVRLPFLGTNPTGGSGPAPQPRAGSSISVPAVGLAVGVVDYSDCSGNVEMTRTSAVHFLCGPATVTTLVGHNPGVFTPLTRSHTGDRVRYQHDGVEEGFVIAEIHRVSPQQAAAYSQDSSYPHAVLATCAEPDSSAYWIYIATPDGASGPTASRPAADPAPGSAAAAPPAQPQAPPRPAPSPSPSPSPSGGTTLPGGITLPPPPH
ncbi:MAG: hypothetical protein NVSMB17_15810 [Candidatus Dormibacteria bacterium]